MEDINLLQAFLQWLQSMGLPVGTEITRTMHDGTQAVSQAASRAVAYLDMPGLLALAAALGWTSGFRLYAVTFLVGMAGAMNWLALPAGLGILSHPLVLIVSGFMLIVEFFADKIPWLDSIWDSINAFIRIPAGALLAASVFGADSATWGVAAGLLGGSLAATSFAAKTTARAAINTSPEPFSNWGASLFEDGLAVFVVWLAITHPLLFGLLLALMVTTAILLVVLLFKFFKLALRKLRCHPRKVST